jgi:excinuclease ABC subunit C
VPSAIAAARYPARILELVATAKTADRLTEQRKQLPDQPGVYLFRDAKGRVVYVGKAKSIRKRVASHFSGRTQYGSR